MTIKDLQIRIDQLVDQAEAALKNARPGQYSTTPAMRPEDWAALRAAGLAFIESTFAREHSYYGEFDNRLSDSYEYCGKYALGILTAIRGQIRDGWIETTKGLVTAEVFGDFLEMAELCYAIKPGIAIGTPSAILALFSSLKTKARSGIRIRDSALGSS